jgi:hypothetical protein
MSRLTLEIDIDHMTSQELSRLANGECLRDEEVIDAIQKFGKFEGEANLILHKKW